MSNSSRPKLAAVVTTYFKYSHAQHIVDRFLDYLLETGAIEIRHPELMPQTRG